MTTLRNLILWLASYLDVRYLAAKYFIVDFSNSPLYPIFGTGWGSLALGNKLEYCKHVLHFYIDVYKRQAQYDFYVYAYAS